LTCEHVHAAIEPTKHLFTAACAAGLPIFYSTADTRADSVPGRITPTKRPGTPTDAASYAIRTAHVSRLPSEMGNAGKARIEQM
jgi:hypothetical protein